MKTKPNLYISFILTILLFSSCTKEFFAPSNENFQAQSFISKIKCFETNATYKNELLPVDTLSESIPYVNIQSWVVKGKDILMSITVPDDALELYFGASNSKSEYMGLSFSEDYQLIPTGYYQLSISSLKSTNVSTNGYNSYQVVLSSVENIQADEFDLVVSYKTAKGYSNLASTTLDVKSIAPYQENLKVGFQPLSGYTYSITITSPSGKSVKFSSNNGAEIFDNSQLPEATLSYDSNLDFKWIDFSNPEFGGYTLTANIEIEISGSSQYIYLYMAVITEGKIEQVDLDADIQQTGENSALGLVSLIFCYFDELEQKLNIDKIWSDQFPNVIANYLPGGAGREGNSTNTISMGARKDLKAHVKAQLSNVQDASKVLIKLINIDDNSTIICDYSIINNIASISASIEGFKLTNFRIVAGIDNNYNGILDIEEYQAICPGKIRVIPQGLYNENIIILNSASYYREFWDGLTYSPAFIRSFINNKEIDLDGVTYSSMSLSDMEKEFILDYNIGLIFTGENNGLIGNHVFSSNSSLSKDVASSTLLNTIYNNTLNQNSQLVRDYFQNNDDSFHYFEWQITDSDLNFYIKPELTVDEYDLYNTFGTYSKLTATLEVIAQCDNGIITLNSAHITGNLIDLYDFNFDNKNNPADRAFYIQAGYGTLGTGGKVFRVEVQFDSDLSNLTYNFGSCN